MLQARNYTATTGRQIDLVVLHDMEATEGLRTAENIASWFAGENAPRASAHWCHDSDSSVRCVEDKDVAWHAPGANHNGIGHEMAGYARQTRDEWLDPYGEAMIERVAAQVRIDCTRYGIPIRFVGPDGLLRGERGITIHRYVSEAFRRSTHWDTGYHFPEDYFLDLVRGAPATATPAGNVAGADGLTRRGDRGEDVRAWQTILAGAGLIGRGDIDGIFGPQTESATVVFQGKLGVTADGIVGPATRAATARLLAWLAATRPVPAAPPCPGTVRQGDRGPVVRTWQHELNARVYGAGPHRLAVDGVFGPATENIVRDFQGKRRLVVDGIAGPATWRALVG